MLIGSSCVYEVRCLTSCVWREKEYLFMESLSLELNEGHWGRDQKTKTQLLVGFLHACVCVEHLLNMHALKCVCVYHDHVLLSFHIHWI